MGLCASSEHGPSVSCHTVRLRFPPNSSSILLGKPSPWPHSLCCAPIGCLSRFSENAGAFDGPGMPLRARSTRRPNAVVSSHHQTRSAPPGRPGSGGHQRRDCHCVHPHSGAQVPTKRTPLAAMRSFVFNFFSNDCVPTLVFLPSAEGHTHCDVEGPQRTFWNTARWTKNCY